MKKTIKIFFSLILVFTISIIAVLSTSGLNTKKFNNLISKKIKQNNGYINLDLESIKFKLDIKELSLFLETHNPKVYYKNIKIPSDNIKVYIDFLSLIKSETKINKVIFSSNQINVQQLKMLSKSFKPSNFKSFINNKLKNGKINAEVEFYLGEKNSFNNFIARGKVTNLIAEITDDLDLENTSFSFFADRTDILIKNFFGKIKFLSIENGDLKADLSKEINIETSFKSILNHNGKIENVSKFSQKFSYLKYIENIQANLNNNLSLKFDKTYKLKNFDYKNNGEIKKIDVNLKELYLGDFLKQKVDQLTIIDSSIQTNLSPKKNFINLLGKYTLNTNNILNFEMSNTINKEFSNIELIADYDELVDLKILNYFKKKGDLAKIKLRFDKNKNFLKIKKMDYTDNKNLISIKNAIFSEGKFLSLQELSVKTYKENKKNNDFSILLKKNFFIKGVQFDATNLQKILNQNRNNKIFSKVSKNIEIDFKNITIPVSEKLENFKLIGRVENGKFIKISSKGEFGKNNFLDITLKNDKNNKKKYLEIYSDITRPLLTEYNFFKGLTGGKLLYTSIFDKNFSNSKLTIENFKVVNAPGMIKLLSLADLGGLADLAQGEGISFDLLEINMEKNNDELRFNEILAIGPSISVLMEGYQGANITSLRGTLVPAKTLNTLISKIPVIGNIIIPKEVGEGLFGISFKMKGPPGNIKTTINPIRTITPRFIQKIIDKKKKVK